MEASKKGELTCAECIHSAQGVDGESLFCFADPNGRPRATYKTHSCLLLEAKGVRASEPAGPLP